MPHQKLLQNAEALISAAMMNRDDFLIVHDLLQRLIRKNCDAYGRAATVIIPSTKERDILPTDYSGPTFNSKLRSREVFLAQRDAVEKSLHGSFPVHHLPGRGPSSVAALGPVPGMPMTEE